MSKNSVTIFWFRRDLRLHDNKGLYYALKSSENVLPLFIFDDIILDKLPGDDKRVAYIFHLLKNMDNQLREAGSSLLVKKGKPLEVFEQLLEDFNVENVFCNGDHEPYGQTRDQQVRLLLKQHKIPLLTSVDHLVMEKNDVIKAAGDPYLVFTPYSRQWKAELTQDHLHHFQSEELFDRYFKQAVYKMPSLEQIGFSSVVANFPSFEIPEQIIQNYHKTRDFPALDGTTRLGPKLRFGAVSIRKLVKIALSLNETFLNELIWREFYAMILWHFPHVENNAFKSKYNFIPWRNDEDEFSKWCQGLTGYPMVDAGMRQMNNCGFMHNRLRMITAGFLTKHLLTDWRWGQDYFADKLLDFELSSNNGGWQWCAGTGTDAAPYFRIFNPTEQQKKFDPQMKFIKQWIPEFGTDKYPEPMVDHKLARERCFEAYRSVNDL